MNIVDQIIREKTRNTETPLPLSKDIEKIKKVKNPVINWHHTRSRAGFGGYDWELPEYDFSEIERISDIDSYLLQSFRKKLGLFLKEGWSFVSPNTANVDYIEKRLKQITWASKTTVYELISDIVFDLIRFSNSFVVKVRDFDKSGGFKYKHPLTGKEMNPIAGMFVLPASTVEVKVDKNTKQVLKYRQYIDDDKLVWVEYKPEDIAHFCLNRKQGFIVGTPRVLPVIEDIKALRRIEENLELLIMQSLFPLIHYKVGTESLPARTLPGGITEIEQVYAEIQNAPPEGIYVTSNRHEIKMIGSEGRALRIESYLDYFKKRVLAGLSMSAIDVGEGDTANRSTADSMSRSLVDEIKADQQLFEEQFKRMIIDELLLESGKKVDFTDYNEEVRIEFEEIDYDTKVKKENAITQKFLQNLITQDEARIEMGYNVMKEEEWNKSYYKLITEPSRMQSAITGSDVPSIEGVMNKNAPSNQYGTANSPKKSIKDSFSICDWSIEDLRRELSLSKSLGQGNINTIMSVYKDRIKSEVIKEGIANYRKGLSESGLMSLQLESLDNIKEEIKIKNNISKYVDRMFDAIEMSVRENKDVEDYKKIINALDSVGYRLEVIRKTETQRAYNWGTVIGLRLQKINEFSYDMNKDSDKKKKEYIEKNKFLVSEATYFNIAPWHPNSSIKVIRNDNE